MLTSLGKIKRTGRRLFEDHTAQILHNLRDLLLPSHEGSHKLQINLRSLSDADTKCFHGSIYPLHTPLLTDGSFGKEIRLSLEVIFLVENFQRAKQIVRAVIRERQAVSSFIDPPVPRGKSVIKSI